MVYMITYDLSIKGDQNYDKVLSTIEEVATGGYCSFWQSSYLVKSNLTPLEIMKKFKKFLDGKDALVVIQVTDNYEGWLNDKQWDTFNKMF